MSLSEIYSKVLIIVLKYINTDFKAKVLLKNL